MGNIIKFTNEEKKYVWAWAIPRLNDALSSLNLSVKDKKLIRGLVKKFERLGN